MIDENNTTTTTQKRRGRPPLPETRKKRLHGFSANFPQDLWQYMERAVYRNSSPGDMWSIQRFLNTLVREDMERNEGDSEKVEKES